METLEDRTLLSGGLPYATPSTPSQLIADINAANSAGGATTITLAAGTTFAFTSADNFTNGANALPVITGNITIVGNGDTIEGDGQGSNLFRLFDVDGSLTLQDLTLQGGWLTGTGAAAEGAAIYNNGGTVNLGGVTVQSNHAYGSSGINGNGGASALGGGLYSSGGSVSLSNDTFRNNLVFGGNGLGNVYGGAGAGGGVYVTAASSVSLSNDTFQNNLVFGGNGGAASNGGNIGGSASGGGLYVASVSSVSLINVTLSGNGAFGGKGGNGGTDGFQANGGDGASALGGGLYLAGGSVVLSSVSLSGNVAQGGVGGGGIRAGAGGDSEGGGLYVNASSVSLINGALNGNRALGGNGGTGGSASGTTRNPGSGGRGGIGEGGGLFTNAVRNVVLSRDTFTLDVAIGGHGGGAGDGLGGDFARGGRGGNGGIGGPGLGGGLHVAVDNISLIDDTLSGNFAFGGPGGNGGNGGTTSKDGGKGGNGNNGGVAAVGGLYVLAAKSVALINDTVSNNGVRGGTGGDGGKGGDGGGYTFFGSNRGGDGGNGGSGGDSTGGGLYVPSTSFNLLANTLIAENSLMANLGGAGGSGGTGGGGGSNFPGNGADGASGSASFLSAPDVLGNVSSSDHDLIGDPSGSSGFSTTNGDLLGTSTNPLDPHLGPLQNNGGPTPTMALLSGSPAIDAGDSSAPHLPPSDQRGYARIVGNAVDIGAYEYGATNPGPRDLSISGNVLSSADVTSSAPPGGQLTYTLTFANNSSSAQRNVTLADQLPDNTTLVSWTAADGWSSSAPTAGSSSGTVTAWIASLDPNSSATFTLVVQVNSDTPLHTVLSNTVSIAPAANLSNNSVRFNTTVLYAPTVNVVDAGGIYNGKTLPATATAVGIDGSTPVAGTFSYTYYAGTSTSGAPLPGAPTNAGTYMVIADFTSRDPDYGSASASATFTITPAPLTVTANNVTIIEGEALSTFTVSYDGFVLSDNYQSLGGTLTFSTTATASSLPGRYSITPSGLTSSNYDITFVPGTLAILSYSEATSKLRTGVDAAGLSHGIQNALDAKLQASLALFKAGDTTAAVNVLEAFINLVSAQSGKKIDAALADALIADAQQIINAVT